MSLSGESPTNISRRNTKDGVQGSGEQESLSQVRGPADMLEGCFMEDKASWVKMVLGKCAHLEIASVSHSRVPV